MMRFVCAVGLALVSTTALADPARDVALKAATCWDQAMSVPKDMKPAVFEVVFDDRGGMVDATVKNYSRDDPHANIFVRTAVRALLKCGPYDGVTGRLEVTMDTKDIPKSSGAIDPFK